MEILKDLRKTDEKIILIGVIGSMEALLHDTITIDETEKFLFSPYMFENLKLKKCDKRIISLIERGCELDDIRLLIPDKFEEEIIKMKNEALELLKGYESFEDLHWISMK